MAQELRGTLAHQAVVESVEASVGTMREQVGALQALVACKVDNADIAVRLFPHVHALHPPYYPTTLLHCRTHTEIVLVS